MIRDHLSHLYPPTYEDSSGFEYQRGDNKLVVIFSDRSGCDVYENRKGIVDGSYVNVTLSEAIRMVGAFHFVSQDLFF